MEYDVSTYFTKIIHSISQVSEDLYSVLDGHSFDFVADIGCGLGIQTYALLSQIYPTTILGIDKDHNAIDFANKSKELLLNLCVDNARNMQLDDEIPLSLFKLLHNRKFPNFLCSDITVKSSSLLSSFSLDLVYCRRLLVNIFNKGNGSAVQKALSTISRELSPNGILLVVEETQGGDFTSFIEHAKFKRINVEMFSYSGEVLPYTRYIYTK